MHWRTVFASPGVSAWSASVGESLEDGGLADIRWKVGPRDTASRTDTSKATNWK